MLPFYYSLCKLTIILHHSKGCEPSAIPIRTTECSKLERYYRRLRGSRHTGCPAHLIGPFQCPLAILQYSTEGYMWILLHQLLHRGFIHLKSEKRICATKEGNKRGNIMQTKWMMELWTPGSFCGIGLFTDTTGLGVFITKQAWRMQCSVRK